MYYSGVNKFDISNGPGIRVSLFVSGCLHKCPECFNPETHSFKNGQPYTKETHDKILSLLNKPYIRGLSLLGGDPLWQTSDDIKDYLIPLVIDTINLGKDVWIWSGFTWEELAEGINKKYNKYNIKDQLEKIKWKTRYDLVSYCDVFVDGRFEIDKKDITLPYCGSTNQRVINVQSTMKHYSNDEIIDLWENKEKTNETY